MTKKPRQKSKYLQNEKNFRGEIKSIFHHFYFHHFFSPLSVAKNCLRPESAPLLDSSISHDEYVLMNNVPKEFDNLKETIKNSNDK